MLDYMIAIPSYARAGSIANGNRFCAANYIKSVAEQTTYYIEPEEVLDYRKVLPKGCKIKGADRADKVRCWASIMDLIIDENIDKCKTLIIMDDDLALAYRPDLPDNPTYFEDMSNKLFEQMIVDLCEATTQVPLASAQYRQFSQGKIAPTQSNQRISMIWALDSKFFRLHQQYRFYRDSGLEFMNDYYFFMKLLVDGHPNLVLNHYTKDDKANAPGGIQSKRTTELLNRSAKQLQEMFPRYVSTYVKQGKGSWEDGVLGVRLLAAKAFKESQASEH
jgi:hypothetical protein